MASNSRWPPDAMHAAHATAAATPARRATPLNVPLAALGAMVVAAVIAIALVRLTGVGAQHEPDAPAVAVREVRFEDRPDGSIAVLDPARRLIETVAPGTNGFLRGTMRGMARERKRQDVSPALPFRLIGRADGKLTLEDPGTGRRVDLASFGPTNAAVFADIMRTAVPAGAAPQADPTATAAPPAAAHAPQAPAPATAREAPVPGAQ